MDTFIVRVYRRGTGHTQDAAGTIEHVESGERTGFIGAAELVLQLLGPSGGSTPEEADAGSGR